MKWFIIRTIIVGIIGGTIFFVYDLNNWGYRLLILFILTIICDLLKYLYENI